MSEKMLKGRNEPKVYIEFLLTFGEIYLEKRLPRKSNFCLTISKGNKLNDIMTTNMEAFMRTVLFIGCSKDWPEYLESEVYKDWLNKRYKIKSKDPGQDKVDNSVTTETGETETVTAVEDGETEAMTAVEDGKIDPDTESRPVSL